MPDSISWESIGEWRRERERVLANRRDRLAGKTSALPARLFGPNDVPALPWIWWAGQLAMLRWPEPAESAAHKFGGSAEAVWSGRSPRVPLHQLFALTPTALPLDLPPSLMELRWLPLLHPLKTSQEPELAYQIIRPGELELVQAPKRRSSDRAWPYPDYPEVLPERSFTVEGPWPAEWTELLPHGGDRTLSIQDLPPESERCLVVVVPAKEEGLGFSLYGPDAEAEEVQIVFLINPQNRRVWTYNQCG